jgi:hypothetical protein
MGSGKRREKLSLQVDLAILVLNARAASFTRTNCLINQAIGRLLLCLILFEPLFADLQEEGPDWLTLCSSAYDLAHLGVQVGIAAVDFFIANTAYLIWCHEIISGIQRTLNAIILIVEPAMNEPFLFQLDRQPRPVGGKRRPFSVCL